MSLDERERALERLAKQGDPTALAAMQRSKRRTAQCAGTVHDSDDLTDDQIRLRNAHDDYAARSPNLVGLLKVCEICGEQVRLRGRAR